MDQTNQGEMTVAQIRDSFKMRLLSPEGVLLCLFWSVPTLMDTTNKLWIEL